jgi:hypothetical protein
MKKQVGGITTRRGRFLVFSENLRGWQGSYYFNKINQVSGIKYIFVVRDGELKDFY